MTLLLRILVVALVLSTLRRWWGAIEVGARVANLGTEPSQPAVGPEQRGKGRGSEPWLDGDSVERRAVVDQLGRAALRRCEPEGRDRWARTVGSGMLAVLVVAPVRLDLVPIAAAVAMLAPMLEARRERRRRELRIGRTLPDVIDLLALSVGAGCNVLLALRHVVRRSDGEVADALRGVLRAHDAGARLADALDGLPARLGANGVPFDAIRPLVGVLNAAERYGAPLVEPLGRLAVDARILRKQAAEASARRLPVKLVFPLITCVLPAFGLLTVAPLLASGLKSLRL